MKTILKRIVMVTGGIIVILPLCVFLASQWRLHKTYDVALTPLRVDTASISVKQGRHVAQISGCIGCHRANGNVLFEAPGIGHLVAPNLTRVAPTYSDAELARLIRRGVKRDGTSAVAMPAASFAALSDADVAAIIVWLRSEPRQPDAQPAGTSWGPLGHVAIAIGKVPFSADMVAANFVSDAPPPLRRPSATPAQEGAYLVKTICSHCHELDVEHDDGWGTIAPPLRMMGQAYPLNEFRHLLRTGKGMGDRELGLMSSVARGDLSHMTDPEIEAIHAYLNATELQASE